MRLRRFLAVSAVAGTMLAGAPMAQAVNGPISPEFFGVQDDRAQADDTGTWGTGRVWAAWCDVEPEATVDVEESAQRMLGSTFRTYADNGTTRLNVTLGHPASWVFDNDPAATSSENIALWFCQYTTANLSFPTSTSLASGPVGRAYEQYVRAVVLAAEPYLAASPDNRLVLQAWNEPNLASGGLVNRGVPGAAATWKAAAASLQQQERIMRKVAKSLIPGRFEISTPAFYGKKTALSTAYFSAQAKKRTVSSASVNFYTFDDGANASLATWRKKAVRAKRVVYRYRALRKLPIWITETNHNLVNYSGNDANLTEPLATEVVQRRLAQVTTMEALRAGFAGIEWYQGSLRQVAVNTRPQTVAQQATAELRSELVGRRLLRCSTTRSTTACRLSARPGSRGITVLWSVKGTGGVTILR